MMSNTAKKVEKLSRFKPCNFTRKSIYEFAEYVAGQTKDKNINIESLIDTDFGGKIEYQQYDDWLQTEEGSIIVRGHRDFTIFISNFTSSTRDRFTIAHELGHYVLHSQMGKIQGRAQRFTALGTKDLVEYEADWFAAGFLMPTKKIKHFKSIYEIAWACNVSLEASRRRLSTLQEFGF